MKDIAHECPPAAEGGAGYESSASLTLRKWLLRVVARSAGVRVGGMFFGFLIAVQLGRLLGPAGYGVYGVSMALISLLCVPTEFGLSELITREVAAAYAQRDWARARAVVRWARNVAAGTTACVVAGAVAWAVTVSRDLSSEEVLTTLVGLVMIPAVAFCNQAASAVKGLQFVSLGQVPNVLVRPAAFSLLLFGASFFPSFARPAGAMLLGVVSAALALASAQMFYRRSMPRGAVFSVDSATKRAWFSSSLPMALNNGMRIVQANLVVLLMGGVAGAVVVGHFRAASSLSILFSMPGTLLGVISAPVISRMYAERDHAGLQRLVGMISGLMAFSAVVLMVPLWLLGEHLVMLVFGAGFEGAVVPLKIMALGFVLSSSMGPGVVFLNMTGLERRVSRAFGLATAFLIATAWPLARAFGAEGGAVAMAMSVAIWNLLAAIDVWKLRSVNSSVVFLLGRMVSGLSRKA